MEIGKKVKVSSPNYSNDLLTGEVIKEGIASNGLVMSKVKFSKYHQVWYADQNLKSEQELELPDKVLH
jgi:hypothetical protein